MNLENLKNVAKSGHLYGLILSDRSDGTYEVFYSMEWPSKHWYKINNRNGNKKFKSLKEVYRVINNLVMCCPRTHTPTVYLSKILPDEVQNVSSQENDQEAKQAELFSWKQDTSTE